MGCCCSKDPEAYELKQAETLHEAMKAYSGDGAITRYNIIRHISFGMQRLARLKLSGDAKKKLLMTTVRQFLDPNAFPAELVEKIIDNFIEDIYLSFKSQFKKRCC